MCCYYYLSAQAILFLVVLFQHPHDSFAFIPSAAVSSPTNHFKQPSAAASSPTNNFKQKENDQLSLNNPALNPLYIQRNCQLLPKASEDNGDDGDDMTLSTIDLAAAVSGVIAVPVVLYSEYVLKTTGCGLPPGPFGLLGALEGISYLAIVGIAGLSVFTKVQTGNGLKPGPFGLLGAIEGITFLTIFLGIFVLFFQIKEYGYIPNAVPDAKCFPES
mmetsp:Transcript_25925/g.34010  ORF Transcript_25925/g.34010 Transcript_25925/m.34010 type:complete len:217 (+) Transcript_25925:85-735(+)